MSFDELLKSLQADYLASLPEKIQLIRAQIESQAVLDLRDSFHKLKGTGRTYGLPEVSQLAELVENLCEQGPGQGIPAARLAAEILSDIHLSYVRGLTFDLLSDPRFQDVSRSLPRDL